MLHLVGGSGAIQEAQEELQVCTYNDLSSWLACPESFYKELFTTCCVASDTRSFSAEGIVSRQMYKHLLGFKCAEKFCHCITQGYVYVGI